MDMVEIVVALLMIVNGEIKEHRIQESMSTCLKGKRIANRVYNSFFVATSSVELVGMNVQLPVRPLQCPE